MAIPYATYDLQANRGIVVVSSPHDTPDFPVEAICHCLRQDGIRLYPGAPELLILADSGGSHVARFRALSWPCRKSWWSATNRASPFAPIRPAFPSGIRWSISSLAI